MYLEIKGLKKSYGKNGSYTEVLKGISTSVDEGQMCVIQGRSGSGKSTFLNCIGGLDIPDDGSVRVDGNEIVELKSSGLSEYRRKNLGFIFQFYNLVQNLTVKENVELVTQICKDPLDIVKTIEAVGLSDRIGNFPSQLSGGEQQRVAIARAIANKPKIIFADEPTAELDTQMALQVMKVFRELVDNEGITVVMTTHDPNMMELGDNVYTLEDGEIVDVV